MGESVLETVRAYWASEGLEQLCARSAADATGAIPPDIVDLVRIHRLVRRGRFFSVLEFGIGYSTLVMADALDKNRRDFTRQGEAPEVRNSQLWRLHCVDANRTWIDVTLGRLPEHLAEHVIVTLSGVTATTHENQLCHLYDQIPDVVPDFIYLDGPDPADVTGSVHGQTFSTPERTVMSADLLLIESTLLPGTIVLVDGRTQNVRFLLRNLRREWEVHREADVTLMRLNESPLGQRAVLARDVFGDVSLP